MNSVIEQEPVQFDCEGSELYGILHKGDPDAQWGVLSIVAGGPQYRAGCGRQLFYFGKALAENGIPMLRFDHRGLGDSEGRFEGFECIEADVAAAIDTFKKSVPSIKHIVLYGGCDGGAAALIYASKFEEVASVIVTNPYASSPEAKRSLERKHYLKRLGEVSFWKKVFAFEYDFASYAKSLMHSLLRRLKRSSNNTTSDESASKKPREHFTERILVTLENFPGPMLFVMSEHSVTRREWDEFVALHPRWQTALGRSDHERIDFPGADQTFSKLQHRNEVSEMIVNWIVNLRSGNNI